MCLRLIFVRSENSTKGHVLRFISQSSYCLHERNKLNCTLFKMTPQLQSSFPNSVQAQQVLQEVNLFVKSNTQCCYTKSRGSFAIKLQTSTLTANDSLVISSKLAYFFLLFNSTVHTKYGVRRSQVNFPLAMKAKHKRLPLFCQYFLCSDRT